MQYLSVCSTKVYFIILHITTLLTKGALFIFFNTTSNTDFKMSSTTYVTKETLAQMREELAQMKGPGRAAIAAAIAEAREKGDLKENAEYDAAKEAQGMHEAKVAQLESAVANSRVIDVNDMDLSRVTILSKVKITNVATKKTVTYQLVGEKEADLKAGKISASSPIGKGLIGKKIGEIAEIQAPNGAMKFKIENITI